MLFTLRSHPAIVINVLSAHPFNILHSISSGAHPIRCLEPLFVFRQGVCPIQLGVSLAEFGAATLLACIEQSHITSNKYLIAIVGPDSNQRIAIVLHRSAAARDSLQAWFHGELLRQRFLQAGAPCSPRPNYIVRTYSQSSKCLVRSQPMHSMLTRPYASRQYE